VTHWNYKRLRIRRYERIFQRWLWGALYLSPINFSDGVSDPWRAEVGRKNGNTPAWTT